MIAGIVSETGACSVYFASCVMMTSVCHKIIQESLCDAVNSCFYLCFCGTRHNCDMLISTKTDGVLHKKLPYIVKKYTCIQFAICCFCNVLVLVDFYPYPSGFVPWHRCSVPGKKP